MFAGYMTRALICVSILISAAMAQAPDPDKYYRLGPDSLEQEGVPRGELRGPFTLPSKVSATGS